MRSLTRSCAPSRSAANDTVAAALQRVLDERLAERLAALAEGARA